MIKPIEERYHFIIYTNIAMIIIGLIWFGVIVGMAIDDNDVIENNVMIYLMMLFAFVFWLSMITFEAAIGFKKS